MAPISKTQATPPPYLSTVHEGASLSAQQHDALRRLEWAFDVSTQRLEAIVHRFLEEFQAGLSDDLTPLLPMIPTYIHDVPDGTEKGVFLALDLGGTNLRVCEVTLNGDQTFKMHAQKYRVSEGLKTGPAPALFDYIAQSVDDFLSEIGTTSSPEEELHLGFTFSFPVKQTALDRGTLITWTKGFKATNAIGNDVVKLLQDALDRKHIHVRCSALVNDTVGTLMARGYQCGSALVGAIFGTGTNGAYVEHLGAITKMSGSFKDLPFDTMIVNTEWGAFDNERKVLPVTVYDNKVDRESINPRKQAFEKMISGMYLGEVTRNVLLFLIDSGVLFDGYSTAVLNNHYGFDTALMSAIEVTAPKTGDTGDPEARLAATRLVLEKDVLMQPDRITKADCAIVQRVCEIVGTRAARLSATAVAVVLKQTKKTGADGASPIQVGVDGSVAEHYPLFEDRLRQALRELVGEATEKRVVVGLAKDGSGVGAALCALQAKKQREMVRH